MVVSQMPPALRSASLSSGESYYSNVIRTPRVKECPMSPSNRLAIVILVKDTTNSLFFDKGKGPVKATPKASQALSEDES